MAFRNVAKNLLAVRLAKSFCCSAEPIPQPIPQYIKIQQYYIDAFKILSAVTGIVGVGVTFGARAMDETVKPLEVKIDTVFRLVSHVKDDQMGIKMDMKEMKQEIKLEMKEMKEEIKLEMKETKEEILVMKSILVELISKKK